MRSVLYKPSLINANLYELLNNQVCVHGGANVMCKTPIPNVILNCNYGECL